jgi:hypothetical protein
MVSGWMWKGERGFHTEESEIETKSDRWRAGMGRNHPCSESEGVTELAG